MNTPTLTAALGVSNNTLIRLVHRGVLTPGGTPGSGNKGYVWDPAEQVAARAVITLLRSPLMPHLGGHTPKTLTTRTAEQAAVAEAARGRPRGPGAPRWVMLLADGTCLLVGDELAAAWPEQRTLISLVDG